VVAPGIANVFDTLRRHAARMMDEIAAIAAIRFGRLLCDRLLDL
jgi:hypothetical protein